MRTARIHRPPRAGLLRRTEWCALAVVCALAAGCRKPVADAPVEKSPPTPGPVIVSATPQPAPQPAPPTPAPPELAPAGVFFLLSKTSITTGDGITGLRAGTRVQKTGAKEYTTADGHKLTLAPNQVTHDLRVARQVIGADTAELNALRQMASRRPVAGTPTTPASVAAATRSSAPAATPGPATPRLGSKGALGAAHTRVRDGWVWERDANGNWYRTKPVR